MFGGVIRAIIAVNPFPGIKIIDIAI